MLLLSVLKHLKLYTQRQNTPLTKYQKFKLHKAIELIESVVNDLDKQGYYKE